MKTPNEVSAFLGLIGWAMGAFNQKEPEPEQGKRKPKPELMGSQFPFTLSEGDTLGFQNSLETKL